MRPRRVTSGTFAGLSPDARAGLHASERAHALLGALEAALDVEVSGDALRAARALLGAALRDAYLAGTELEASYRTALEAEGAIRSRLEALLRAHGIVVPTDRAPSEPPG